MELKVIQVKTVWSWETGLTHFRIVGRPFSEEDFRKLKSAGLIYGMFGEDANEEEIPPGWYIREDYEELEKYGYTFDEETKRKINDLRRKRVETEKMHEVASSLDLRCPKCGKKLEAGEWSPNWAVLRCYKDNYTAIVNKEGKVVDEGFDEEKNREYGVFMFWERVVENKIDKEME